MTDHEQSIFSVKGKTVLVTGGTSGLGLYMVQTLAAHGARVVSLSLPHQDQGCQNQGGQNQGHECLATRQCNAAILSIEGDVCDQSVVAAAFDQAEAMFGPVEVLFNNAGIACKASALDTTPAMLEQIFSVNVTGAFQVAQEAARRMIAAKITGSIINTTSILGAQPQKGAIAYAMSKAALTQMTRSLALEWATYGIRVNALAPGWFPTGINQELLDGPASGFLRAKNPMRRLGQADDLQGVLLLLASQAGCYMTGTTVTVDGGHSLQS